MPAGHWECNQRSPAAVKRVETSTQSLCDDDDVSRTNSDTPHTTLHQFHAFYYKTDSYSNYDIWF